MTRSRALPSWPNFSKNEISVVSKVLSSNKVNYWTGEECRKFESEFCDWSGAKFSIALSNGTVALDLALIALNLKKGDEVIVTPRSFIASVSSVISVGATPIFADVDETTGNINAETIETKISKKTKAIICVHLGGLPCEMDSIIQLSKKHNLFVIEDCAQAHGATYKGKSVGSLGDIAAWSFCQDKIMTTGGEGGMVTTNSKSLWNKMRSYKDHGKNYSLINSKNNKPGFKWIHDSFGTNWRMTEMQAAIGRVQLKKIDRWNRLRNRNANIIITSLSKFNSLINVVEVPDHINHAYYRVYANLVTDNSYKSISRDKIINKVSSHGVPCFSGSCPEIYNEKAFDNTNLRPAKRLRNAKKLGETSLAFLCHPNLTCEDMNYVSKKINAALDEVLS